MRCSRTNCKHLGAALPFSEHIIYEELDHGNPRKIPIDSIAQVLGKGPRLMHQLQQDVRDSLVAHHFDRAAKITSSANVDLVGRIVESLRPLMDTNRGSPTKETEHYIRAALTALVIKEQKSQRDRYSREQAGSDGTRDAFQAETVDLTQRQLAEKQLSFYKKSRKLDLELKKEEAISTYPTIIGHVEEASSTCNLQPTASHKRYGWNAVGLHQPQGPQLFGPTSMQATNNSTREAVPPSGSGQGTLDLCIAFHQTQREVVNDFTHSMDHNIHQLITVKEQFVAKEEEVGALTQQTLSLHRDNADLGCAIAILTNANFGNLKAQMKNTGLSTETIDRLLDDPEFERKFTKSRKRRRRSETNLSFRTGEIN